MKTIQEELGSSQEEENEMLLKSKSKKWDENQKTFRKKNCQNAPNESTGS
jgi:ATP-dependent Lon protease